MLRPEERIDIGLCWRLVIGSGSSWRERWMALAHQSVSVISAKVLSATGTDL